MRCFNCFLFRVWLALFVLLDSYLPAILKKQEFFPHKQFYCVLICLFGSLIAYSLDYFMNHLSCLHVRTVVHSFYYVYSFFVSLIYFYLCLPLYQCCECGSLSTLLARLSFLSVCISVSLSLSLICCLCMSFSFALLAYVYYFHFLPSPFTWRSSISSPFI